jgi:hypothetical protein
VQAAVPVSEIVRPATQEPVEFLHDHFDRVAEPLAIRDFTDPLAGSLHCLSRGPAGEKPQVLVATLAAHPAVTQPLSTLKPWHQLTRKRRR